MNRIFHARIGVAHCLALVLLTVLLIYGFFSRDVLFALPAMLLLVLLVERLIHTEYTITPTEGVVIDSGRFSKKRVIAFAEITSVKPVSIMRIGRFCLLRYVLLEYGKGQHETVLPLKEDEFIRLLRKRMDEVAEQV